MEASPQTALDQPPLDGVAALPPPKVFARELCDGQAVETPFLVRDRSRRQKRNGDAFLKLQLGDRTGAVEAVVWDEVEQAAEVCRPGAVVVVNGKHALDGRYGACLTVRSVRPASDAEYDPADLSDGPSVAFDQMVAALRDLISTVQSPPLRALLERLLGEDSEVWPRWAQAPAAKHYLQAYRHGLLDHCLSVAHGVSV